MATSDTNVCYLTVREASELIRTQQLSPVELVRSFLDRIEAIDHKLHAFITVTEEGAMAAARSAEAEILRGRYRGPLHGVPIGLKDCFDSAGIRSTNGSLIDQDRIAPEDSTAYARLKAAGAILVGKLATYEYHMGGPSFDSPFPPCRNPWNLDHIPGGSSTGSGAGVAAGLVMGAMGADTGGSVRLPAAICGIVGLKPTYGRISRFGIVTLSWTEDHPGPMAWTVEDTATLLQAVAGYDPKDPTTSSAPVPDYALSLREEVKGITIGVPRHFFAPSPELNQDVVTRIEEALAVFEELGAEVREVNIPALAYARAASQIILFSDGYAFHEKRLKARPQDFVEMTRSRLRLGGLLNSSDYVQAQRYRHRAVRELSETLRQVDVLVTPTSTQPGVAFKDFDASQPFRDPSQTAAFNLTGLPAMSVPCGFTSNGLPVGMQIVSKPFGEPTVLRVGYTYQQYARWFERRPPI